MSNLQYSGAPQNCAVKATEPRNPQGKGKVRTQANTTTNSEDLLKMQLSMTCDLPTMMNQLQLKEGYLTSNEALRTMYSDSSTVHLKRTARALASLSTDSDENFETSDRLPAIALPLILAPGNSSTKLPAQGPKRSLAAPPKTRIMPVSDPNELRALIESLQQKRMEQIEQTTTCNRLATRPLKTSRRRKGSLTTMLRDTFHRLCHFAVQAMA